MATAAPTPELPLLYQSLEVLNATQHGKMKIRRLEKMERIGSAHAIPPPKRRPDYIRGACEPRNRAHSSKPRPGRSVGNARPGAMLSQTS